MTDTLETSINLNGRQIPYRVVRSTRARRMRVTVKDGRVTVTLPRGVRVGEAERLLRQHAEWLFKHLDQKPRSRTGAAALPPDVILLRGKAIRIEIVEESGRKARIRVVESGDRLVVRAPVGVQQAPRQLVLPWLRDLAREEISAQAAVQARRMGLRYKSLSIRDQKTRWGSCSSRGTLSFNWRLVMTPPTVMQYVVIHELAHLHQPNHSPAFWQLVSSYYPQYKEARAWLRKNTAALRPADME